MNRRKFLKIAGSASVILAAGGGGFAATRTPVAALKPWEDAGSAYTDPMRRALSYAILAPNPHNRQPWMVALTSDTEAVLTCDLTRLLGVTDPFSRQIVIGLGCFAELFSMAAADHGYRADIRFFPDGMPDDALDRRPIAHLSLTRQEGLAGAPGFASVLARHTNRDPYDTGQAVSEAVLRRLRDAPKSAVQTGTTADTTLLGDLRLATRDAMLTEFATPRAHQETVNLMRIGRREIEANPDGIALGGPFLEALALAGLLSRESLANPASRAYQMGLEMVRAGAMSAMGFVWVTTPDNSRQAQIEAGRAYMRIALQASTDRLAMQPMSQGLQEYPAMAPYRKKLHEWLAGAPGVQVQMLARLGYAPNSGPTPRWPLASRIRAV